MTVVAEGDGYTVTNCADGRLTCEQIRTDVIPAALQYLDTALHCAADTVGPATDGARERSECRSKARKSRSDKARRLSQQELDDFYKTI